MHTAEQAKNLWCPMARVAHTPPMSGSVAFNRGTGAKALCFSDGCAMWRWVENREPSAAVPEGFLGQPRPGRIIEPTHGYCGLAGKP